MEGFIFVFFFVFFLWFEFFFFFFIEKLRTHPTAKNIPIIICSAKDITPKEKEELNGNILAIVQKGTHTKEDLLAAIKKIEQLREKKYV